ncbi:hypothetical protein C8R44DRAFT_212417 [Mycena epipterygia]|nr:hypothetical protein C8R44DRAFT_212417 [Mycena epipterygia]
MFGNGVMDVRGRSHKLIFPATIERAHLEARHRQYQPPSILASNNFFRKSPTFHNRRKSFTAYKVLGRGASVVIDYRPVQTRGQVGRPAAAAWCSTKTPELPLPRIVGRQLFSTAHTTVYAPDCSMRARVMNLWPPSFDARVPYTLHRRCPKQAHTRTGGYSSLQVEEMRDERYRVHLDGVICGNYWAAREHDGHCGSSSIDVRSWSPVAAMSLGLKVDIVWAQTTKILYSAPTRGWKRTWRGR